MHTCTCILFPPLLVRISENKLSSSLIKCNSCINSLATCSCISIQKKKIAFQKLITPVSTGCLFAVVSICSTIHGVIKQIRLSKHPQWLLLDFLFKGYNRVFCHHWVHVQWNVHYLWSYVIGNLIGHQHFLSILIAFDMYASCGEIEYMDSKKKNMSNKLEKCESSQCMQTCI